MVHGGIDNDFWMDVPQVTIKHMLATMFTHIL